MDKCIICKINSGTKSIIDATQFPDRFNGKPICDSCDKDREILKDLK